MIYFTNVPKALLFETDDSAEPHEGKWTDLVTTTGNWDTPIDTHQALPELGYSIDHVGYNFWIDGYNDSTRTIVALYGDDLEYSYSFKRIAKYGG